MGVLKWIGYIVAAMVVLCVGSGIVTLVVVSVLIVGALISIAAVIGVTARLIKGLVES